MGNVIGEARKVQEVIKRMNPAIDVEYEGMLALLKKTNPTINIEKISEISKRVMYLQLTAQMIEESCSTIKKVIVDSQKTEEITQFQKSISEFCSNCIIYAKDTADIETFNDKQTIASELFLKKWNEITNNLSSQTFK